MPVATDNPLTDAPLWLKLVGSVLTGLGVLWAVALAFVEPWADARFMRRLRRCSDALETYMRSEMFAAEYESAAQRDERLDAIEDRLTKIDASQWQQGEALRELPTQLKILERLAYTMDNVNRTMGSLQFEVKTVAEEQATMRGMIEAWREPSPGNPLRPRKTRARREADG